MATAHPKEEPMSNLDAGSQTADQSRNLLRALLILRITLGIFLLQWGIEKFVVPGNTPAIWGYFYGLSLPEVAAYVFGTAEIVIAIGMILGVFRTWIYGAAVVLHCLSVIISWRQLMAPWADPYNHLFIAGVPVLGAFIALYLLRHHDRSLWAGR
jgi:putative oxidoreductase